MDRLAGVSQVEPWLNTVPSVKPRTRCPSGRLWSRLALSDKFWCPGGASSRRRFEARAIQRTRSNKGVTIYMNSSTTKIIESRTGKTAVEEELLGRALDEWIVPALARHVLAAQQRTNTYSSGETTIGYATGKDKAT